MDINKIKTRQQQREYTFNEAMERLEQIKEGKAIEPLAISKTYTLTIELSAGGPADGFILEFEDSKDWMFDSLIGGKYYYSWGFYQEIDLTYEEAKQVAKYYLQ